MSRPPRPTRKGARPTQKTQNPPVVLVFGEDDHDRRAIKSLIEALAPSLIGKVQLRRQPLVLIKGSTPETARTNAQDIADVVSGDAVEHDVICVFAHQDCDAVEPAHVEVAERIEQELSQAGLSQAHAVTPAWEIEAWWFLFPDAVKAARPSWRRPDQHEGKEVGRIVNAKERFRACVRPPGAKPTFTGYSESDSIDIAAQIKERGLAHQPQAISRSYEAFRARVRTCVARFSPQRPASSPARGAASARRRRRT